MALDCLQIRIFSKQPRLPYFCFKARFVLDTAEHIICRNGNLVFLSTQLCVKECCMEEKHSRPRVKICYRVFLFRVLQHYFRLFLLALHFAIVQDICRRQCCRDLKFVQKQATGKEDSSVTYANVLFFSTLNIYTYHQAKN